MAYEDLTPQERQVLQQSLLAPPPATFAAPGQLNIDPQTRMEAQLGLLGPQGRFIEQLARQQDEAQREARSVQMAQTLQGISPLDPEYVSKVQTIAKSDPLAFNSGTVQQVLQLGQMAKQDERRAQEDAREARGAELAQAILSAPANSFTSILTQAARQDLPAFSTPLVQEAIQTKRLEVGERQAKRQARREIKQERAQAEVKATIANATPDQLDQLAERFPQFLPDIENRGKDLSTIEEAASQLPPSLRTPENLSKGHKAKAALNKFNKSLPPRCRSSRPMSSAKRRRKPRTHTSSRPRRLRRQSSKTRAQSPRPHWKTCADWPPWNSA